MGVQGAGGGGLGAKPPEKFENSVSEALRKIRFLTKNAKFGGLEPWKSSILAKLRQNKGKLRVISARSADFFDLPPFFLQFFLDFWIFPRGKGGGNFPPPFSRGGGKVPQVPQWRAAPACNRWTCTQISKHLKAMHETIWKLVWKMEKYSEK